MIIIYGLLNCGTEIDKCELQSVYDWIVYAIRGVPWDAPKSLWKMIFSRDTTYFDRQKDRDVLAFIKRMNFEF